MALGAIGCLKRMALRSRRWRTGRGALALSICLAFKGTATCDEFRDALRDAQLLGIEDSIWRRWQRVIPRTCLRPIFDTF